MHPPTASDDDLVRASQKGDRTAFEELVRRTSRLLYARIYLDTRDTHRTEDLLQETYLRAWKSIGQFGPPAAADRAVATHDDAGAAATDQSTDDAAPQAPPAFRAWLCSIARTVTIDAARHEGRKKRTAPTEDRSLNLKTENSEPSPADAAADAESRDRAVALLAALPEQYRQPLLLRYVSGADYHAIGRQLGLTNGALRGLLNRGLTLLRNKFQADPAEPAGARSRQA